MKMLKGFDFKAFFVDHGEKIGFGLGVFITLLVLGMTTWSRYPKAPDDILKKVSEARDKLKASVWPEETRASFSLKDFMQKLQQDCFKADIDYVPIDTSVSFDKALMEYLLNRQKRF